MQKYNLYEFSGFLLIEKLKQSGYEAIDFSTRIKKSLAGVIKTVETHNNNAMFYQALKCMNSMSKINEEDDDVLKNALIYIDFSDVFPFEKYAEKKYHWSRKKELTKEQAAERKKQIKECGENVEEFFSRGFTIKHPEGIGEISYVPFEKSASMARAASMLFIDSRMYENMEKRIRLGFNFCSSMISVSRLYAYTGLYLSDAKRINESPDFILDEETVIILSDNAPKDKENEKKRISVPIEVISADEEEATELKGFQKWDIKKYEAEEYKTTISYFDGEGLISPQYCSAVNKALNTEYGMTGTASSIQIRMPFAKGMLHSVDFHGFICESLNIESCKGIWVIDAYGRRRSLEKAQIILTQSMFKIDKWLTKSEITSIKRSEDPLALYFKRFHDYDHAFYVGITDMNLSQAGKTKLNYQFLNTLALTSEEFDEITNEQAELATSGKGKELLENIISDNPEGDTDASFDDVPMERETWCEVAGKKPAFLNDPKVKGMLKGVRYSLLKDLGRGRLTVSGSTKFLSRDLLAMLLFIVGKIESGNIISDEQKQQARDEIRKEQLWTTKFFVADCLSDNPVFSDRNRKLKLCSGFYYGLLRSPHLSRNEQCSLRPYIPRAESYYSRYFGHLKGILMVPQFSYVPQALGGADFDGDMVKLITDKRINRAINDACYYPDTDESDRDHRRKLPIVMIPNTSPRKTYLPEDGVDFRTIKDTFTSRVGEISNHAIYLGKREYDMNNPNPDYDLNCETCTILTGLEIDAAKTGRHPYLADILAGRSKDYFVARKDEIAKLPAQHFYEVKEYPETQNTVGLILPHRLAAVTRYGPNTGDELMFSTITEDYDDYYLIDRLPQRFLSELSKQPTQDIEGNKTEFRFAFEKNADWKQKAADPHKTEILTELIYSYRRILETSRNVYKIEERLKRSNYTGCINTILKIQNKGILEDYQLTELQEMVLSQLLAQFDSYYATEKALEKLVSDNHWQFCETEEEKRKYLQNILFEGNKRMLSDEVQSIINNFRWNGYYLLYYYIKDIMLYYHEAETELRIAQVENNSSLSDHKAGFYEEFREIYAQALSEKESKKIWNRRIVEKCRIILQDIFRDRVDIALMYTHKLRNHDQYGTFFWDVFTANEIIQKSEGSSDA